MKLRKIEVTVVSDRRFPSFLIFIFEASSLSLKIVNIHSLIANMGESGTHGMPERVS